jgi:hypothetical protein
MKRTRERCFAAAVGLLGLLLTVLGARAATAGDGCVATPCLTPSLSQAEALFAKIERQYPQYFGPAAATQTLQDGNDTAYYRSYANALSVGLATYQGGLWFTLGGAWTRYSALDGANQEFCGGTCWSVALAEGCGTTPCLTPSLSQAEALFAKIERQYPQYFGPAAATQTLQIGLDAAHHRSYANALSAGLATYLGGLWYSLGGAWIYHSTLDEANRQFCDRTCWTSPATRPAFTMTQTLSEGAQRTTLAFSGLAMLTGNLDAQSFFPPGKVADYTGFQYLRDNDPDDMGHNTSFLTRVANNVIYILNDSQFAQLKTLAAAQIDQISLYGYKRYPLMKAFRRLLEGDIPSGSIGLNLNAVKKASRELYLLDGQISFDRAVLYAALLRSMDATQTAHLEAMKGKGWSSWPDITNDQVKHKMQGLPPGTAVAVMTYASDLFSWYAGSVEADVYFCPERHGTYFGSFYIKDAPAIGHEGYGINEQLTATAGAALSDSSKGYVTQEQAATMSSLVAAQSANLYASPTSSILKARTDIATLLRLLLSTTGAENAIKAQVLELSGVYGDLDGESNHAYATTFARVYQTLTTAQKASLAALRKSIMSGTYADGTPFDFSVCTTPFLYSGPIADPTLLVPYLDNTDYLFFEP